MRHVHTHVPLYAAPHPGAGDVAHLHHALGRFDRWCLCPGCGAIGTLSGPASRRVRWHPLDAHAERRKAEAAAWNERTGDVR